MLNKTLYWFLMTPVVFTGLFVYLPLLLISELGEKCDTLSDRLADADWREHYIKWCENKAGVRSDE